MVGRRRKIKKKHRLKRPIAVPKKRNLNQNINYLKSHIWDSFFENSISGIQSFYICPDIPVDAIRDFFLISKLLAESLRNNKNQQKRSHILQYSFAKIILNSVDNENNTLPNTAKNLSDFTNFLANMFLCGVRKNICTESFLDTQELHS